MREIRTYGRIEGGVLKLSYSEKFKSEIKFMTDGRIELILKKLYGKRTLPQNAYYFGYLLNEFVEGYKEMTGEITTTEEAHDFLKNKFNYIEITNPETGEIEKMPQTTTTKTTVEFIEYQEDCIRFISEWFGRTIIAPKKQTEIEL